MTDEDILQNAINEFNHDPDKGVLSLCATKRLSPSPQSIAAILSSTAGLLPSQLGKYLSNPVNEQILFKYFMLRNLSTSITEAMHRAFSNTFELPKEGEDIDYVLQIFSNSYNFINPNAYPSNDTTFVLAYALLMLNTDLHNPNQKHHMTFQQFLINTRLVLSGDEISDMELHNYYHAIQDHPIMFNVVIDEKVSTSSTHCSGPLKKHNDSWLSISRERYFILNNNGLYYYEDQEAVTLQRPKGMIEIEGTETSVLEGNGFLITAKSGNSIKYVKFSKNGSEAVSNVKKIFLEAPNDRERAKWLFRIRQIQQKCESNPSKSPKRIPLSLQRSQSAALDLSPSKKHKNHLMEETID